MNSNDEQSLAPNYSKRIGAHNLVVKDDNSEEQKEVEQAAMNDKQTFGMIYSNRPTAAAGIGKMSEYAQTGIYIDPN